MYLQVGCAAAVVLLLSGPVLPQALLPDGHQHHRHLDDLKVGHKALFTLGALAVLGGASYYIGRHVGKHDSQQLGYLGYGYPSAYSHGHYSPYGHYGQYGNYGNYGHFGNYGHQAQFGLLKQKPFKGGFSAGVYARPLLYGRKKRQAEEDYDLKISNSLDDDLQPATGGRQGAAACSHSNQDVPPTAPGTPKNRVTKDKKENEISSEKNEEKVGPGFEKKLRRRRSARRPTLVVTSQPISVSDDPYTSNRVELLSAKIPKRNMKPEQKLRPEPRGTHHGHYNLHSRLKDARVAAAPEAPPLSRDESPKRYRPREPEARQELLCEDGSQARNFEYFELMMLESALAEDDKGCGLSLVCEIGRVPLHLLPPKALGLRRLLTGTKPRGLDGVVWGALTESLLGGLSGHDCSQRHHHCPTPPAELMSVFARL